MKFFFWSLRCWLGVTRQTGLAGGDVIFFEVGEVLKENIDFENGKIVWAATWLFPSVAMFDKWCNVAREACVIWVLIAKRMGLKQGRIIARMVWESRRVGRGRVGLERKDLRVGNNS